VGLRGGLVADVAQQREASAVFLVGGRLLDLGVVLFVDLPFVGIVCPVGELLLFTGFGEVIAGSLVEGAVVDDLRVFGVDEDEPIFDHVLVSAFV
jgi:hypothetical protein